MHESSHDDCGCCADVHFGALLNQTLRNAQHILQEENTNQERGNTNC